MPNPYTVRVTSATSSELIKGGYQATMTVREVLSYGSLKNSSDNCKYGFFSPIDDHGRAIAGEGTMIEGVCYWTKSGNDKEHDSIEVMSPDTKVTFGQIILRNPENNYTALPSGERKFQGFKGITALIENSINPIKGGTQGGEKKYYHYADTNTGMMMAHVTAYLEGGKVRVASEPQPLKDEKYPSVKNIPQYVRDIGTQDVHILFTNFKDRITDGTDVKAPHIHIVPKVILDKVRELQGQGKDINKPSDLKEINEEIRKLVKSNQLVVGGHVLTLGEGNIIGDIRFQPVQQCIMIDKNNITEKTIPLTDDRTAFIKVLNEKAQKIKYNPDDENTFIAQFQASLLQKRKNIQR